jgi:hypothetical protein
MVATASATDWRQLEFPAVLPHSKILPVDRQPKPRSVPLFWRFAALRIGSVPSPRILTGSCLFDIHYHPTEVLLAGLSLTPSPDFQRRERPSSAVDSEH